MELERENCAGGHLSDLAVGRVATVTEVVTPDVELLRKLLAMGIVRGALVEISHVAPLGCPISIKTKGHNLSLRLNEAECVGVR